MIDQEKFHDALAAFLGERRIGPNAHPFAHVLRAGNLRTRHPVDDRFAIGAELGFPVRPHFWKSHFDQAHPAVPRRAEFLVVAIARDVAAGFLARLDHASAFRKLKPDAVDLDVDHLLRCRRVRHVQFVIVLLLVIEAREDRARSRARVRARVRVFISDRAGSGGFFPIGVTL